MKRAVVLCVVLAAALAGMASSQVIRIPGSPYPVPVEETAPEIVVLYERNFNQTTGELLVLMSLSGGLAQTSPEIWVYNDSGMRFWLQDILTYNVSVSKALPWTAPLKVVLEYYRDKIDGYILAGPTGSPSVNIAVSLCGAVQRSEGYLLLAVPAEQQPLVEGLGFTMVMDVTSISLEDAVNKVGIAAFADSTIVYQEPEKIGVALADYAIMAGALVVYEDTSSIIGMMDYRRWTALLGWGEGEGDLVALATRHRMFMNAADWAIDLPILLGIGRQHGIQWPLCQINHRVANTSCSRRISSSSPSPPPASASSASSAALAFASPYSGKTIAAEPAMKAQTNPNPPRHTVCFLVTDGDNIQAYLNMIVASKDWWRSRSRGTVPISWTMSPALLELAPTVTKYFYRTATPNDYFVASPSGVGYMYPDSKYTNRGDLSRFITQTGIYMNQTDMRHLNVLSVNPPTQQEMDDMVSSPHIEAVFWYLYSKYSALNGSISWARGDKPVIGARAMLWPGFHTPKTLADLINTLPADPTLPESYSLIPVHLWDESVESIAETASLFNQSHVQVVTADEFVRRIVENVRR